MSREIKFRAWDGEQMSYFPLFWNHAEYLDETEVNIMQYTGLKDKKGQKIYEGDIYSVWKDKGNPEVVEWRRGGFRLPDGVYIEVIGNIYESPELLS